MENTGGGILSDGPFSEFQVSERLAASMDEKRFLTSAECLTIECTSESRNHLMEQYANQNQVRDYPKRT
jgi:hypothetical protein